MRNQKAQRPFYGWRIVVVSTILMFLASGIGFYSHSVILVPLQNLHGWSRGIISSAVTLYFFIFSISGVFIGRKVDQIGSKPILIIGAIIFSSGFLLLSHINQIWQLFLVYSVLAIGFSCTFLIPISSLIVNWFIQKRGLAMSLTMNGLSIGGMVLVPIMTISISRWGITTTLTSLGCLFLVVFIFISLFFVVQRPSDLNQSPDGISDVDYSISRRQTGQLERVQTKKWTQAQAMRTLPFWSVVVTFLLAQGAQIAFLIHQIPFLIHYLNPIEAGFIVSFTTGASVVGRTILGIFIDRYDKRLITSICILLQASVVMAMAFYQYMPVLYLGTFVFGLTMGSILMLQSLIIGDCFGLVSFGTISGISGLFIGMGASFGPMIAGFIYDMTESYQISFIVFACTGLVAAISIYFAKPIGDPIGTN